MAAQTLPVVSGDKDRSLQEAVARLGVSPRPGGADADPIVTTTRRLPAVPPEFAPLPDGTDERLKASLAARGAFLLADTLSKLGMRDAFVGGTADFSGIDGTRTLFIGQVIHKAFVAVDETGTEAAAATAVILRAAGVAEAPLVVNIDRPFIFLIRDNATGAVLFVGRVMKPA